MRRFFIFFLMITASCTPTPPKQQPVSISHPEIIMDSTGGPSQCSTCHQETFNEWKKISKAPDCGSCHSPIRKIDNKTRPSQVLLTKNMMKDTLTIDLQYHPHHLLLSLQPNPLRISHALPTGGKDLSTEVIVTVLNKDGEEVAYIKERLRPKLKTNLTPLEKRTYKYEIDLNNGPYHYSYQAISYPPGRAPVVIAASEALLELKGAPKQK